MSKHDHDIEQRDLAGIGPHLRAGARLVPLKEREDLEIPDGEPDIRGWDARTVSGREIGKVEDLLVDADTDEIVLLRIDLPGTGRHALTPLRFVQVDRARRVVLIDSAEVRDATDFPTLARDGVLTDEEIRRFGPEVERAREVAREGSSVVTDEGGAALPGQVEERVVERRPVVYEEVVVRRRVVDPDSAKSADSPSAETRAAEERTAELERHETPDQRP